MSRDGDGEFGAAYWEERYRSGGGASRLDPSPPLLAEASDLPPGRALDAGCGWGADALWLAARGWHVTAVDVSPTAVEQARQAAEATAPDAAARIHWLAADLTTWDPSPAGFDLVTSHYVHVPGPPEALFARLASWVAPGGTLLVVGHGHAPGHDGGHHAPGDHHAPDGHHGQPDSPAAGARVRIHEVTSSLRAGAWEIAVAEPRTHTISRPGGPPAVLNDVVVRARRAAHEATHGCALPDGTDVGRPVVPPDAAGRPCATSRPPRTT